MAIDFAIFSLFTVVSIALCVFGLYGGKRELGVLTLVGAVLLIVFTGQLAGDRDIIVGYNAATPITYTLPDTLVLAVGTIGFVLFLWGSLKIAGMI